MEAILKIVGAFSTMIVVVAILAYTTAKYLVHIDRSSNKTPN